MHIRELNENDVEALVPLFDRYRQFYRKESNLDESRAFLQNRFMKKEATIFGAFVDDQLIGFTLLYPLFSSVRMKPIFLLNDLFVSSEERNKAIGKKMLVHAQNYAIEKKYAGVMMETEKTNDVGNHLYPSMGFQLESGSNYFFWENINA